MGTTKDDLTDRGQQMRTLLACTAGVCIANIAWWIQPQLISELEATELDESQSGLVASVEIRSVGCEFRPTVAHH